MFSSLSTFILSLLESTTFLSILLAFFLLQASLYSGVEAAFLSLDRININRFENSKSFFAVKVTFFLKNFDNFIISILLFNLLNHTFSIVTASRLVKKLLEQYKPELFGNVLSMDKPFELGAILFMAFFTGLLLIVSEITPKRIAIRYSSTVAKIGTIPMTVIYTVLRPFTYVLRKVSKQLIKVVTHEQDHHNTQFDKHEFITYVKRGAGEGVIKKIESMMLTNLINYKNVPIKSLLIPRTEMAGFDLHNLPDNLTNEILNFKYNTFPVYDKVKDNVIGFFSKKRYATMSKIKDISTKNIKKYITKPLILPENKNIVDVLYDLQKESQDMALITDEYGGIEGFVTYSDIVKRLLGKYEDSDKNLPNIRKINQFLYFVNPQMSIDSVNDYFKTKIECDNAETIGGYIIENMNTIPKAGFRWQDGYFEYTVKGSTKRKITRLTVRVKG